jgi:DNA-directed RNA polymerase specialized sigma24 family protein
MWIGSTAPTSSRYRPRLCDAFRSTGRAGASPSSVGGAAPRLNLEEVPDFGSGRAREPIALDDALNVLTKIDERKARVIQLRFFGGLSVGETAEVLKV